MVAETLTNAEKIAANEIISSSVEDKVLTPTFVAVHCTLAKGNSLLSVNHSECWHLPTIGQSQFCHFHNLSLQMNYKFQKASIGLSVQDYTYKTPSFLEDHSGLGLLVLFIHKFLCQTSVNLSTIP